MPCWFFHLTTSLLDKVWLKAIQSLVRWKSHDSTVSQTWCDLCLGFRSHKGAQKMCLKPEHIFFQTVQPPAKSSSFEKSRCVKCLRPLLPSMVSPKDPCVTTIFCSDIGTGSKNHSAQWGTEAFDILRSVDRWRFYWRQHCLKMMEFGFGVQQRDTVRIPSLLMQELSLGLYLLCDGIPFKINKVCNLPPYTSQFSST